MPERDDGPTIEVSWAGCLGIIAVGCLVLFLAYHGGELAEIVLDWLRG